MSGAVDIGREALLRLSAVLTHNPDLRVRQAVAPILALRAALDAAERERDEALEKVANYRSHDRHMATVNSQIQRELDATRAQRNAADATGYARGVRDADELARAYLIGRPPAEDAYRECILALLPKEKNDAR